MERGTLRIGSDGLAPGLSGVGLPWPWSLVRASIDPLVVAAAYVPALLVHDQPFSQADLSILLVAVFCTFPGEVPFRRFTPEVCAHLASSWARVAAAVGLAWAAAWLLALPLHPHGFVVVTWLAAAAASLTLAHAISPRLAAFIRPHFPSRKIAVVGLNDVGERVSRAIAQQTPAGRFVGFFDDRGPERLPPHMAAAVIGNLGEVGAFVKSRAIDTVYISLPMATQPRVLALLVALRDTTASVHFLADISVADLIQGSVTVLGGVPVVSVCETPFSGPAAALKRSLDLLFVVASLPLVIPAIVAIAVAIRATSPGPAFFRQRRYGLDGKEIVVLKFRTMTGSDDGRAAFRQVERGDARVTKVGAFLRRTSMDELPQLLNVLGGSMSLIGPRPHALSVNEQFRKLIPGYMVRHKVKPGITGWAQVNGCRGGDDLESMRKRTEYDLAYLRSWSLRLDLLIILLTARLLILGDKNAF
jgi:putative colanic acid biosynthesis UDP-glucose lipid carrier transferase